MTEGTLKTPVWCLICIIIQKDWIWLQQSFFNEANVWCGSLPGFPCSSSPVPDVIQILFLVLRTTPQSKLHYLLCPRTCSSKRPKITEQVDRFAPRPSQVLVLSVEDLKTGTLDLAKRKQAWVLEEGRGVCNTAYPGEGGGFSPLFYSWSFVTGHLVFISFF